MYIWLLYVYNRCLLCCSFLLIFYYEFYYSFYYKATENRGKQRITEDNGTITEYREKAQKRYVSGLLKWLYYIIHEFIIYTGKTSVDIVIFVSFIHFAVPFLRLFSSDSHGRMQAVHPSLHPFRSSHADSCRSLVY